MLRTKRPDHPGAVAIILLRFFAAAKMRSSRGRQSDFAIRMPEEAGSTGIALQDAGSPGKTIGHERPVFPVNYAINHNGWINHVPGNLARCICAAGMKVEEAGIAKSGASPAFVVFPGVPGKAATRVNARVP